MRPTRARPTRARLTRARLTRARPIRALLIRALPIRARLTRVQEINLRLSFIATVLFISIIFSPPLLHAGGGEQPKAEHWKRPFNISGDNEVSYEPYPDSCKACHASQYNDWSASLHSGSMSPGVLTQLDTHLRPGQSIGCYFCHAPAIEQSEVIERSEASGQSDLFKPPGAYDEDTLADNPLFDKRLKETGVNCVVCHMRSGVVNGPPNPSELTGEAHNPPHETKELPLFESAEFCAACHQMDMGYVLNGKVLTNTYNEWKDSYYGENNITCQKCHMPGRRHQFRGIHDPEMVRKGLDIKVLRVPTETGIKAALTIKNARVGHMFPTYVTPIVVVKAYLQDANEEPIEESIEKGFIGRLVSQDLNVEYFDTRLKPFQTFTLDYDTQERDLTDARKLVFEITVRPDEFYDRLFKRAYEFEDSGFKDDELNEAVKRTAASPYVLFKEEFLIEE